MQEDRGIITGHYITHWGVPTDIRLRRLHEDQDIAILEFGPRANRTSWRYATNGMSRYLQSYAEGHVLVRTEIFACTRDRVLWVDDLLLAVANYPFENRTYIAEGDTIDVGQPVDRGKSPYLGILLAPPGPDNAPTLGLVAKLDETVLVHQVVGLTSRELKLAIGRGGKAIWAELSKTGESLLDQPRPPWKSQLDDTF